MATKKERKAKKKVEATFRKNIKKAGGKKVRADKYDMKDAVERLKKK